MRRHFARGAHPGVRHHAEVIVKAGENRKSCEDCKRRMVRFDEPLKNKIFPEKARRRWKASERKQEEQEQQSGYGIALVEAIEIVERLPDLPVLSQDDEDRKDTDGHKDIGEEVGKHSSDRGIALH